MKKSNGMVFVNTTIQKQFTNGPKVSAEFQIIVSQNNSDEWIFDCVEPLEIDEIEMMGVKITDLENKRKAIAHFKSMGINLWDEMCKDMNEVIAMSGGAVVFVKEQTEIILPTKKTVAEPTDIVELTKFETDYIKVMADLKQKFGRLGYYNDKRKDSRRIKIQSSQSKCIKKYMKTKYPHIETYYNNEGEWELCFILPI
jgi:hypothetical protein